MLKRQSNIMFISILVIAGTIFLQMGLYCMSIIAGWDVRFNLVIVCHSVIKSFGLSFNTDLMHSFFPLSSFQFGKFVRKFSGQLRTKECLSNIKEKKLTFEMNKSYSGGREEFTVISYPAPMAVTMGFFRPRIILSTGLMQLLNEDEMEAVIYHELYHQNSRDPLKIFLISLISSTIWYIPILKWFHQKHKIVKELLADEYAMEKQGNPADLGSALLKMIKVGNQIKMPFSYVSFADTSVNYRIKYILDPLTEPSLKFPVKLTVMSLYIFFMLCGLFIYALS